MNAPFRFLGPEEISMMSGSERARYLDRALEVIRTGHRSDPQFRMQGPGRRLSAEELDQLLHLQQVAYLKRAISDLKERIRRLIEEGGETEHQRQIAEMQRAISDLAHRIGQEVDRQREAGRV